MKLSSLFPWGRIESTLICMHATLEKIMATQAELAAELRALKEQNDRNRQEVLAKIAALEEAIAQAGGTTPEVDGALADLKASIQAGDDEVVPG